MELNDHPLGHGFDPSHTEGCPERGDGTLKKCGLCGCPTVSGMPMSILQAPPPDCLRFTEHEGGA